MGWNDLHSCALVAEGGRVYCSGDNRQSALGAGPDPERRAEPMPVLGVIDATLLTTGWLFGCVARAPADVLCWGANQLGQLGIGADTPNEPPTAVVLP